MLGLGLAGSAAPSLPPLAAGGAPAVGEAAAADLGWPNENLPAPGLLAPNATLGLAEVAGAVAAASLPSSASPIGLAENALPPDAACPPNENLDAGAGAFFASSADGALPGLAVPHAPHFILSRGDSTMHVSHRHVVDAAAPPFDQRPPPPPPAAPAAPPSPLAVTGAEEESLPAAPPPLGAGVAAPAPFVYSDWHLTNSCMNASAVSRSFTLSKNTYLPLLQRKAREYSSERSNRSR